MITATTYRAPTDGREVADTLAADGFTDADWQLIEQVADALEALGEATPSRIARKARLPYTQAVRVALDYLIGEQSAHTSGNGCWTHYHHGRRGR